MDDGGLTPSDIAVGTTHYAFLSVLTSESAGHGDMYGTTRSATVP
jgi:hypothetical protein